MARKALRTISWLKGALKDFQKLPEAAMTEKSGTEESDDFELIRGSGNVYTDLGIKNPEQRQLRAILAAEIGKTLADEKLTVRAAEKITGVAAADFSRIRQAKLKGFTIDRLMTILDRLGRDVRVSVVVLPRVGGSRRQVQALHA